MPHNCKISRCVETLTWPSTSQFLGQLLRVDLIIKWISNVRPPIHMSARSQKVFDFHEIWYVGKRSMSDAWWCAVGFSFPGAGFPPIFIPEFPGMKRPWFPEKNGNKFSTNFIESETTNSIAKRSNGQGTSCKQSQSLYQSFAAL